MNLHAAWLRKPWETCWHDAWGLDAENLHGWEVAEPMEPAAVMLTGPDLSTLSLKTVWLVLAWIPASLRSWIPASLRSWIPDGSQEPRRLVVYMAPDDQAARCELALFLYCLPLLGFIDTRVRCFG